jgi:hypothetical protein
MKKILLFALLAAFSGTAFSQVYNLQFNPKAGDKYDVTTETKSAIQQSVQGQDMTIKMNMTANMLYEMAKADDNAVLNWTYQKLGSEMEMMGQSITMSSEEDTPESKIFKALKGAKLSFVINKKGEVISVNGVDDLNTHLSNFSDQEKQALAAFINGENLKGSIEMEQKVFPNNPVKIGDTWTTTFEMKTLYKLTSTNTFKLVKVENNIAYIEFTGTISTGEAQATTIQGMEANITLSGDAKGTLQMDMATGMVTTSEGSQTMKGKVEVMGMEIPMTVTTVVKTTIAKM